MNRLFSRIQYPDKANVESDMAISRILTFLLLIIQSWGLARFQKFSAVFPEMQTPGGLSLPSIYELSRLLSNATWVYNIALVLALVGFLTPLSILTAAVFLSVAVSHSFSYGYSSHDSLPLVVLLILLVLSGCGRRYSLDALLSRRFGWTTGPARERVLLSSAAVRAYLTLIAFASGVAKLRIGGFDWVFSENLRHIFIRQNHYFADKISFALQPELNHFVTSVPHLPMLLAIGLITVDLLAPLANFHRAFFYKFVVFFALFQIGNYLLMYINFVTWLPLYLFWIPWTKLHAKWVSIRRFNFRHMW